MHDPRTAVHGASGRGRAPRRPRRRRPGRRRVGQTLAPGLAAAAVAALTYVVAGWVRGVFPFTSVSRNINDLGEQVIPMHLHYRDILTGSAHGDLLFTWSSGYGVGFLADFAAYVGSTLSWFTVLLPRSSGDLALWAEATVALGLAAAAMTGYLLRVRAGGPAWLAVAAGVAYATCGWALDDGIYMTMWLNGLVAFPVLALVADWALTSRRARVLAIAPVVVALMWTSQFYVAYMATIGAGLVTLARFLTLPSSVPLRSRLAGLARVLFVLMAGIGLAGPLLVPVLRAVAQATPSPKDRFTPLAWPDFLSRLLPGSEGVGSSPGLAVGTLCLALAVSLPFNRRLPVRDRLVWPTLAVVTVLSMQVPFTHEAWHGFDTPNGSPFRQSFVAAGILVIAAWVAASRGLSRHAAAGAALVVTALWLAVRSARFVTPTAEVMLPLSLVVLVALGTLLARPRWRRLAGALIVALVAVESTAAAVAIDSARARVLEAHPLWGPLNDQISALVTQNDTWPLHRVSAGRQVTYNDAMLMGGEGSEYYSSTIPNTVSRSLVALGFGYSSYGRALRDPVNPVVDAVFAVSGRVAVDTGQARLQAQLAAPLVTLRPAAWVSADPVPFGPQETALGADVYTVPAVEIAAGPGVSDPAGQVPIRLRPAAGQTATATLSAECPSASVLYLWTPGLVGQATFAGNTVLGLPGGTGRPLVYTTSPLTYLGTVASDGRISVLIEAWRASSIPRSALGCLSTARLGDAVAALRDTAPADVRVGGHSIDITLPGGTSGLVTVAATRVPGWSCTVGSGPRSVPGTVAGLIAVPVTGQDRSVSCSFAPPGLRLGLAVGAVSLAAILGVCALLLRRRRLAARGRLPAHQGKAGAVGRPLGQVRRPAEEPP